LFPPDAPTGLISNQLKLKGRTKRKARRAYAAPGFIVESSLEDSKVLVVAMGAQDFSRQRKTLLPKRKGDD
jgi:hypothetical protein